MIRILQALLFFLAFSIEIEIQAQIISLVEQNSLIQYPENCESDCGFKTYKNRKFNLRANDNLALVFGGDTIVVKKSDNSWALVQGELVVQANPGNYIHIPMAKIEIHEKDSVFYISKSENKYIVRCMFGRVAIHPVGSEESVLLTGGYENQIQGVGAKGVVQVGFPSPILIHEFLPKWASLYNGTRKEFYTLVKQFKPHHETAVKEISETYASVANRMIASYEEEKAKKIENEKRKKEEKIFLQKMFKNRALGLE